MSHHNCPKPASRTRTDDLKVLAVAVLRDKLLNTSRLNEHVMDTIDLLVSYVETAIGVKTRIDWSAMDDSELPAVKEWQTYCTDLFDSVLDYATQAVLNAGEPTVSEPGVPSKDFFRPVSSVEIRGHDMQADRESGVRAYCYMAGAAWNLQLRAPLTLRNGRPGKDFMIATATLEKPDMVALRDTLTEFLAR